MQRFLLLLIFVEILFSINEAKNLTCANGFTIYNNYCYLIGKNGKKIAWSDARLHCQALGKGVDLASIHDAFEQGFLSEQSNGDDTWIGLYNEDGDWTWVDNTPYSYTDWAQGQPSGDGPCGHLDQKHGMLWNDNNCDGVYGFFEYYVTQYACKVKAS